ncbi:MAG: HTH domain-containing protein [Eubacteriales bacterium]
MTRSRKLFSAYEMELLAQNPYTYRVRARQLLFTAKFKRRFWEQYERGGDVQQIFESMGYDPLIVGYTRMHSVPQNLRKVVEAGRPFTDGYSGRGKHTSETDLHKSRSEQEAAEMQYEIAHLRQHVEFLKKLQRQATGTSGGNDDYDAKPKIRVDSRDSSYR